MYKNKSMNWDTLIRICLAFIIFIIQESGGSPDAVSTGSNEAPWMWMSTGNDLNENNSGTEVLEVVELIEDTHVMTAPIELNTEPRFVGHLRRKLCKVGLGIGCGKGNKEKERYDIEPQEINFVQPLVIQAIGKPIPAVPAVAGANKKANSRKDIQEAFQKFQNNLDSFNILNNKMASYNNLNMRPFPNSLNNVGIPSTGLSASEAGYSPVYSNSRLDLNTNNYGGDPPIAPPPIVFKSPRPNIFGPPYNGPPSSYLDLSSSSQTSNVVRNHHSIPDIPQPNIFSTPLPSIVKADLLNSLQSINRFDNNIHSFPPTNPGPEFPNLMTNPSSPPLIVTQSPFINMQLNQGGLDAFANNIRQLPQIIKLNNKPTSKIQVVDLTGRPKKEALSSSFGTGGKLLEEEVGDGEKVVKHIHVHKHIHHMNEDTTSKMFKSVKDNLDAFSTSLLSSTDPEFVSSNSLKRFLKNSKRESHKNFDSNSMLNLVKTNFGNCICMHRQKCPSNFISDPAMNRREDMTFVQNPRNKPNGSPILSTSNLPRAEALKGRVIPTNETEKIKQVIKPRLKNTEETNNQSQSSETNERKIVLNIKRINKRDSHPVISNATELYKSVLQLFKENEIIENRENEESFGITNKRLFKRDISHFLGNSKNLKHHITGNDLPFSCGLHEVCCNIDNIESSLNHVDVSVPSRSSSEPRSCGRSTVDAIKGRITGGLPTRGETKFGEFPWQAAILKKEGNDNVYVCAGSLIDKSHVLTAAHCVEGYTAGLLRVRLGEWDVNRDTEFYPHVEYDVVGLAIHPDFYSGNLINDIAIVRMLYPIDLTKMPHISPVCLPTPGFSFAGSRCWVSGWGKNAFGKSGKYQNLLKKVDLPIIPRQTCNAILRETRLGPGYSLHPGMMCAGGEPKRDACKGDGGGPLSCKDIDGNFVLSGIVSWGIGCGQPGVPGIYINVEYYVGWIRQMIES